MSERFLDYPPLEERFPEAVRKRVFWPCWSYLVPLKGVNLDTFNSFDNLVLELAGAGITGVRNLSTRTGLEEDLLVFIQDRLFHRGFLDEHLNPTEQARVHLEKAPKSQERTSYCYVYRDAVSGAILNSLVPQGEEVLLYCSSIEEIERGFAYYPMTTAGRETGRQSIRALRYPQGLEEQPLPEPTPGDVSALIRSRERKTGATSRSANWEVETEGIKGEKVYIAVDIILQKGNSRNWIVSDGFGTGFSPVFEGSIALLEQDDLNWLADLKKNSAARVIEVGKAEAGAVEDLKHSTSPLQKIREDLSSCKTLMEKYPKTTCSTDRTALRIEDSSKAVRALYGALEWSSSLLASRSRYSDPCITEMYQLGDAIAIARTATRIARSLGFVLPNGDQFPLFRAKPGAVKGSYLGIPSLGPLFALSLFNARRSPEHPLRIFARTYPDAIKKLADLKKLRDSASHTQPDPLSKAELEAWMALVNDYVKRLIPEAVERDCFAPASELTFKRDQRRILTFKRDQRRILAEAKADRNLGYAVLRALPSSIADLAVEVETRFVESPVTGRAVLPLDILLGSVFQVLLENRGSGGAVGERERELGKRALEKARRAGIRIDAKKLESIFTAKDGSIRNALNGNGSSLQASCAAWLLSLPEDELYERASASTELAGVIEAAARIAKLRGHGEEPRTGTYTEAELKKLKQVVFNFIKNLVKGNRLQG